MYHNSTIFAIEIRITGLLCMMATHLKRNGRLVVTPSDFKCTTTNLILPNICQVFLDNTYF